MGHCIGYYLPPKWAMVAVGTELEMPPFVSESDEYLQTIQRVDFTRAWFYSLKMVDNIKTKHNTWAKFIQEKPSM